jgi:O-6-methylguanine DNA methyltransferase
MVYRAGGVEVSFTDIGSLEIQLRGLPDAGLLAHAALEHGESGPGEIFRMLGAVLKADVPDAVEALLQPFLKRCPAFTRAVYRKLIRVPRGRVVSYSTLAAMAGTPGAVRAAAHAMCCNPLPLLIPCHRVIHVDGSIGAYAGIADNPLKVRLLEQEGIRVQHGIVPEELFIYKEQL